MISYKNYKITRRIFHGLKLNTDQERRSHLTEEAIRELFGFRATLGSNNAMHALQVSSERSVGNRWKQMVSGWMTKLCQRAVCILTYRHKWAKFWVICSTPVNGTDVTWYPLLPFWCWCGPWSTMREASSCLCRWPHFTYSVCTVCKQAACFRYSVGIWKKKCVEIINKILIGGDHFIARYKRLYTKLTVSVRWAFIA